MSPEYKVTATFTYKGASIESRTYPHGNTTVVAKFGRDYLGSFNSAATAKRAVTAYLKRGTPPT